MLTWYVIFKQLLVYFYFILHDGSLCETSLGMPCPIVPEPQNGASVTIVSSRRRQSSSSSVEVNLDLIFYFSSGLYVLLYVRVSVSKVIVE